MAQKRDVLDAAIALTLELGTVPSLAQVAHAVGLTKQGVLHHFPSRAALDDAVLMSALTRLDDALATAAQDGRAAETYLLLAAPSVEDRAAALVLLTTLRRGEGTPMPSMVHEAVERWESLIAEELGDPLRATVVRLVGDGLFSQSLVTGVPPSSELLDDLIAHLIGASSGSRA